MFGRLNEMAAKEIETKKTVADLETRLLSLSEAQQESTSSLDGKLRSHQIELSSAVSELAVLRIEVNVQTKYSDNYHFNNFIYNQKFVF